MKKAILGLMALLLVVFMSGCTDKEGAMRVLSNQGYTEIVIHGHSFYGCSENEVFATKFTAMNPANRPVNGVVCRDHFSSSSIRLD